MIVPSKTLSCVYQLYKIVEYFDISQRKTINNQGIEGREGY